MDDNHGLDVSLVLKLERALSVFLVPILAPTGLMTRIQWQVQRSRVLDVRSAKSREGRCERICRNCWGLAGATLAW